MRAVVLLVITLVAQTRFTSIPQPDGKPFHVRLPEAVTDSCTVDAFQTGSFGGYSGGPEVVRVTSQHTLNIPTSKAATSLKAAVWCKGFGVGVVDVPSLSSSNYQTTLTLPPLPGLRVTTRMQPDDAAILAGQDLQVTFEAGWICGLFNITDCVVPRIPVATARIGKEGASAFELPDVVNDPIIRKYGLVGGFAFDVEEPAPSFNHYRLEPASGRTLAPASGYRDAVVLSIKR